MKNYDRIKAMSVEEMAEWMASHLTCSTCVNDYCNGLGHCRDKHLEWLQQEADANE